MSEKEYIEFQCEYMPSIAGGPARKFATENFPLRVDYYGTNQLAHCGCEQSPDRQTVIFQSSASARTFIVRVPIHAEHTPGDGVQQPFFEAGAYETINETMRASRKNEVSASTSVILNFYATTYTTLEQRCWTSVGMAVVPLADWMKSSKSVGTIQYDVVHYRDSEPDPPKAKFNPPHKGVVNVSRFVSKGVTMRAAKVQNDDIDQKLLQGPIDRGMAVFFPEHRTKPRSCLTHPTEKYLAPYHVPINQQRRRLASATYVMLKSKKPMSVPYYERLLKIALARGGASANDALLWSAFVDDDDAAMYRKASATVDQTAFFSLGVRLITANPLAQRYLDDVVNRNVQGRAYSDNNVKPDEDFKICRLCGGDDCEGVCLETIMHYRDLVEADDSLLASMSELLRRIAKMLRLFVPMMTLGCVTNKKATAATLDESTALAHTFCALVPFWQFYNMCEPRSRDWLLRTRAYNANKALLDRFRSTEGGNHFFITTIGEATAPIDPAMRPVETYYEKNERDRSMAKQATRSASDRRSLCDQVIAILDRHNLSEVLQPEMLGPPNERASGTEVPDYSGFYKFFMSGSTPLFAETRRLDFAFALDQSDGDCSYGVAFDQIIDQDKVDGVPVPTRFLKPRLVPYLQFTEEEARACDAALMEMSPIPSYSLPKENWKSHPSVTQWDAYLKALVREIPAGVRQDRGTSLHPRRQFLTIYARDMSAAAMDSIQRIARLPSVVGFDYAWHGVNAALDGTSDDNIILDIYLMF